MSRYYFGAFLLDTESRVLLRDGQPLSVTSKVLDTLTILVENRGRLMNRDELLSRLWPDTQVEEANLTQNVFTLRKILGDSPKHAVYIATIPGRGYQFVAKVTEVSTPCAPESERVAGVAKARRLDVNLPFWAAAAIAVLIVAAPGLWIISRNRNPKAATSQAVPFTTLVGAVDAPAFSPDGKQIAFAWTAEDGTRSLYVKIIGQTGQLRITYPPGDDFGPAWSPDGGRIAFYRDSPGATGFYYVSALGGPVRLIVACDLGRQSTLLSWNPNFIDWLPDGKHVVIAQTPDSRPSPDARDIADHARLVSVEIDSGEQKTLTFPPASALGDTQPRVSRDGKMLAFVRTSTAGASELLAVDLHGQDMPREVATFAGSIWGFTWMPDSRSFVASEYHGTGSRLWRVRLNGGLVEPITSSAELVYDPAISPHDGRLVYLVVTLVNELWKIDLARAYPPEIGSIGPLIRSFRWQFNPAYSPDGRQLAFVSDSGSSSGIWTSTSEGKDLEQLTGTRTALEGTPRWSPDGSSIVFDSTADGNTNVYVVSIRGGKPRRVTKDPAEDVAPSWSRDGKWIYFASNRKNNFQIWKVRANAEESPVSPAIQVTEGGGFGAIESADRQYLYFAKGRNQRGLWRKPLHPESSHAEELVLDSLQHWGWWALGRRGIYFLQQPNEASNSKVQLKSFDLRLRKTTTLAELEKKVNPGSPTLTLSPDGFHIVYEQAQASSNIVMVDNFR